VTALLATTLAFSSSAEAINLIGNLPANDFDGSLIGDMPPDQLGAVGFTLPVGVGYQLDNIVLRLSEYNTSTDVALLQIYADPAKTSTSPLGTTLQSVFFANPTSASDGASNFTFTPTSNFTFAADTKYWLLVDAIHLVIILGTGVILLSRFYFKYLLSISEALVIVEDQITVIHYAMTFKMSRII